MNHIKNNKYYMMTVKKGCDVTYLYTGDVANEGTYCVKIRGILQYEQGTHTIIANAVPYTGHSSDLRRVHFSKFESGIAITVAEETPLFTTPNSSFFKIIHDNKWNPCRQPPPEYY